MAAWHTATAVCVLLLLSSMRRISTKRVVIAIGIIVALLAIGILTGRRKIFVEIAIFVSVYISLLALFGKGGAKLAIGAILGGVFSYVLVVWLVDEQAIGMSAQDALRYQRYAERSATVGYDVSERFIGMGLAPVEWAIDGFGWLGGGLGVASQGAQHFGGGAEVFGGAGEGGLGQDYGRVGSAGVGDRALVWVRRGALRLACAGIRIGALVCRRATGVRSGRIPRREPCGLLRRYPALRRSLRIVAAGLDGRLLSGDAGACRARICATKRVARTRAFAATENDAERQFRSPRGPTLIRGGHGGRVRLALFATHPIQYHVPWFVALATRPELELVVFFGMVPDALQQGIGFGVGFQWDIPLLGGYEYEVLQNVARRPALGTFAGCDTPMVAGRLRRWNPDVAILTGWQSKMLVQAWWACVRLGVPRIVRGESNAMPHRPAWKRAAHRVWLRGFDRFLAIGKANRDFYLQAGIPEERIHTCPYFVDNERFAAATARLRGRRGELRQAWSIPDRATCFLFCGKLIAKKHPLDFLLALQRAVAAGASVHALVVGDGDLMTEARALFERERLPVTFAGFLNQTEIVSAYVAADCLVLPSDTGETWGLVVNEAMACGIPAIVSDQVGCGPDLVSDDVTGTTFPMGAIDALAQRMIDLSADPGRLNAMGVAARERVSARYSVQCAVNGTMAAIDSVIARG